MWIDDARGTLVDWTTQRWVQATGRRVSLAECPWLDEPRGKPVGIGHRVFDHDASERGLLIERGGLRGLLQRFESLTGPDFDPASVSPVVAEFYEQTSAYEFDAWSSGNVRADHTLTLFGATFLRLHCRLRRRPENRAEDHGAALQLDAAAI